MEALGIFSGISQQNLDQMFRCFNARKLIFPKGQTIMTYTDNLQKIGVLLSGRAHLYCIDRDGSYTLLERFEANDLFGELFALPIPTWEYIVEADSDCEVMFISYASIIRRCSNACEHHSRLVDNLFHLATKKSQALSFRINLLSTRTIRQRLLNYLSWQQTKNGSRTFTMDMSLTELAAYLCVDRSSLMREMRSMKNEGLLQSKGRRISLPPEGERFDVPENQASFR